MSIVLEGLDFSGTAVFEKDSDPPRAPLQLIEIDVSPNYQTSKINTESEKWGSIWPHNGHNRVCEAIASNLISHVGACHSYWYSVSTRDAKYTGSMLPISMSSESFQHIAPYARIPKLYLGILYHKTPVHIFCTPELPPSNQTTSPKLVRKEHLSFIIHSVPGALEAVCMGASFTYHFTTRTMYIFLHGLSHPNYHRFSTMLENGAAKSTPFFIPTLLIQRLLESLLDCLNDWHEQIYSYETELGIRVDVQETANRNYLDFPRLSKNVNAVITNLGYVSLSCAATVRMLDFMDKVISEYGTLAIENGMDKDEVEEIQILLRERHEYLKSWNQGLEERAKYLLIRGQALVQTVYSGIAQRDSANSIKLAAASTRLAESSQNIAVLTSRDSAVMRLIAAITIFFLPATFVATFFSTSFFDFSVGRSGRVYSWWLWLYFLVTILLTAAVLLGTWIMWKNKENELAAHFKRPQTKVSSDGEASEKA
ncbi:hypothetical protein P154DRAFT_586834 [Amniculicola lignicola CBS 123094]|uniref:Cora-domain-containing protein n=1 Tax=Amniculicola lignicola CBS 123094 TaxID=1392246 RepID=A0A6A5VX50_9PLEO|nr:hypothetical protein P154DRAFT_586834 [Amniculicola lignicola CBS 123094]